MAIQRYISTSFWDDEWIMSLDPSEKFIYLYLMTNPLTNIAGVYKITVKRICFDTGYNTDTVEKVLNRFKESKKAYLLNGYMIIPTWPKHQKWETKSQIKKGIESILKDLNPEMLECLKSIGYLYPIDTISISYQYEHSYLNSDIDIDIDIDSNKDIDKKEKSASVIINELIKYWNEKCNLPKCPYCSVTLPKIRDVTERLNVFSGDVLKKAIDTFSAFYEKEDARYRPSSFQNFIVNSIDRWVETAKPEERYKLEHPEQPKTTEDYLKGAEDFGGTY